MEELSETFPVALEFPICQIVKSFSKGENKHSGSSNPVDYIALGRSTQENYRYLFVFLGLDIALLSRGMSVDGKKYIVIITFMSDIPKGLLFICIFGSYWSVGSFSSLGPSK